MVEADDAGVVAFVGGPALEHLGVRVQRVTDVDRTAEPQPTARQLGERLLGGVLARQTEHDRGGDEPEHDAPCRRAALSRIAKSFQ